MAHSFALLGGARLRSIRERHHWQVTPEIRRFHPSGAHFRLLWCHSSLDLLWTTSGCFRGVSFLFESRALAHKGIVVHGGDCGYRLSISR